MGQRLIWAVASLFCLVLAPAICFAQDLSGTYEVRGNNPDGSAYTGSAVIAMGPGKCRVDWKTGPSTSFGICRLKGETFTVNFVLKGGKGVVVYQVLRDGDMTGQWWMNGHEKHKGREKLLLRKLTSPSV